MHQNIWKKLSSGQKLNLIGAFLLSISLFLGWYSDKDVFRSGDYFTALNGPLYFVGISILLLCLINIGTLIYSTWKVRSAPRWQESPLGKEQMIIGFLSMYLLMIINSVYFHPQFGLNILSKKSEIGVMLALAATVMICVGGYISYRKKFDKEEANLPVRQVVDDSIPADINTAQTPASVTPMNQSAPIMASASTFVPTQTAANTPSPAPTIPAIAQAMQLSERSPIGKTEYERNKLYENLKKTMIRDTLTPDKRRKLIEKESNQNVFSADFGKKSKTVGGTMKALGSAQEGTSRVARATVANAARSVTGAVPRATATAGTSTTEKKPQMYRMDL